MSRILVMRGGAVGDFVLTLPVLAALRGRFPRHRIEILGYPAIAELAVAGGLADEVAALESPRLSGFFAEGGSWSAEVAAWFAGFECILSYLYDPEEIFCANVARCSSARFIAGLHRPDETLAVHATEQLLQPLQALGINRADPQPRLKLSDGPAVAPWLAIHPGSGSERKNWPETKWAELLRRIIADSARDVLLIGGEAEGDRCARLGEMLPGDRVHIAQKLSLVELARRMQNCHAFIGHDSGITHLAAALGLPGLVLWGETNLEVWGPRSERMKMLREPGGLKELPATVVWQELKTFL